MDLDEHPLEVGLLLTEELDGEEVLSGHDVVVLGLCRETTPGDGEAVGLLGGGQQDML